jgi:hypothetical protein
MVSHDPNIRNAELFHTPETIAGGTGGVALQNGNNIQDDMVRYVTEFSVWNSGVGYHAITVYAGDAANTKRRVIFSGGVPPFTTVNFPANAETNGPFLKVVPNTIAGAATQENGIYFEDDTIAGTIVNHIRMTYYDKRA